MLLLVLVNTKLFKTAYGAYKPYQPFLLRCLKVISMCFWLFDSGTELQWPLQGKMPLALGGGGL
jgi:hypothetical protein